MWSITITKARLSVMYWPAGISWHLSGVEPLSWQKRVRVSHENIQPATLQSGNRHEPFSEEQKACSPRTGKEWKERLLSSISTGKGSLLLLPETIHYRETWQLHTVLEQADSCLMIQNQQGFVSSHHTAEEFHREMEGTSHSWDFLPKVKKEKEKSYRASLLFRGFTKKPLKQ